MSESSVPSEVSGASPAPASGRLLGWAQVALLVILVVALGLRLGYLAEQRHDILFDHPVVDEAEYVGAARTLLAGEAPAATQPYWQPPGIVYALTAVMTAAGPGLLAPRVVQAVASTLACLLLFLLARPLFGERIALAATAVLALHGAVIFASHELLAPTWVLLFDLFALWLLQRSGDSARFGPACAGGAGLALGVSAVFTPVILPFAGAAVGLLWWRERARRRRRWLVPLACAIGVMLPIAPVAARNFRANGELVLVSTNGGLNFYIGNNAHAQETIALRPGRHFENLLEEPRRAGITEGGAASRYYYRKALAWMRAEPGRAALGYLRKLALFANGAEIPRDTDIYEARRRSRILKTLVWPAPTPFPSGILIPLALLGIWASWPKRRRLAMLYVFLALQAAVIAAFFVTSRYRVPSLPLLSLFAVVGALHLAGAFQRRSWRRAGALSAALVALLVLCNLSTAETRTSFRGELSFYRGLAYLQERGQPLPAIRHLRIATQESPEDPRPWLELGTAFASTGRRTEAIRAWLRAAELDPWDTRSTRLAADALAESGDRRGAIEAVERSIAAGARQPAHYGVDHMRLGLLWSLERNPARANESLRRSLALGREEFLRLVRENLALRPEEGGVTDTGFWAAIAELCAQAGDPDAAAAARERAGAGIAEP